MREEKSELFSVKEIRAIRPEPIVADLEVVSYNRSMPVQIAIDALLEGYSVLISDYYNSGLLVLNALKKHLQRDDSNPKTDNADEISRAFQQQREFRAHYRKYSHRILILINQHKINIKKAPEIGWLKLLYPELKTFLLPFPQVQGLNSAWQWYQKGIHIPVLDRKIYPWFGTYFPTRFEHLQLFNSWLKTYKGKKNLAIDIGIGSGILSFLIEKHGFDKVIGTDTNPNALIGLDEDLKNNKLVGKIALKYGDLFADLDLKTELIVFNPPWMPAKYDVEGMDAAIYYDNQLFPRFFAEAVKHLRRSGKVVLLFSNLAQITKQTDIHPIEEELKKGGRFQQEYFVQKKVGQASAKTKRNQNWRQTECVELWVLKMINNS
ncbi:MAG: methyltransferase [Bacteroidales bacterium]|nr:methyltransferase [Bacteroidales bacterium]